MDHRVEYLHRAHRGRKEISVALCAVYEGQDHMKPPVFLKQKVATRWRSGTCRLCGKWSTYISQEHARRHGFKDADEMAKAGVMDWTE